MTRTLLVVAIILGLTGCATRPQPMGTVIIGMSGLRGRAGRAAFWGRQSRR